MPIETHYFKTLNRFPTLALISHPVLNQPNPNQNCIHIPNPYLKSILDSYCERKWVVFVIRLCHNFSWKRHSNQCIQYKYSYACMYNCTAIRAYTNIGATGHRVTCCLLIFNYWYNACFVLFLSAVWRINIFNNNNGNQSPVCQSSRGSVAC